MMSGSFIRKASILGVMLFSASVMTLVATAQTSRTKPKVATTTTTQAATYRYAYQHGYRGGYEDGFTKGKSDNTENQPRDFASSQAYQNADGKYRESMGTRAEYQEGYRIGFEMGYNDGYFGRTYSTTMPTNLGKAVIAAVNASGGGEAVSTTSRPRTTDDRRYNETPRPVETRPSDTRSRASETARGTVYVPDGTQMKIRLTTEINTKTNKQGDRFIAVVLDPSEYAEATIEGHIAKLNKSGKATGKTELALAFDTIRLRDGRSGKLAAQVDRVYESEKVKTVDEEGNVQSGSRTTDTAVRSVGGAALGAIIGGIAGGGKGAAIGAAIGAGAGAGSVFIEGGKEMVLEQGTEILIRTASPARSSQN